MTNPVPPPEAAPPPEVSAPQRVVQGSRTAVAAAVKGENRMPLETISSLGPCREFDGQAAAISFQVRPKFAQGGTYTSLEVAIFVTDYYPAGNAPARTQVLDELIQWAEDALDRQAGRFNQWRQSMGHTGEWSPK